MGNDRRHHELRAKVLFGQPWTIEEQLEVWELLTGERIQHGRRCNKCDCSGRVVKDFMKYGLHLGPGGLDLFMDCRDCNGSGYTVRPTWMMENNVK